MEGTPIIIKKKKAHGHAHHGGSWKVAYADFVTAMMAFFMVMWILGLSDESKSQISGYFNDPMGYSKTQPMTRNIVKFPGTPVSGGTVQQQKTTLMRQQKLTIVYLYKKLHEELKMALAAGVKDENGHVVDVKKLAENLDVSITKEGLRIEFKDGATPAFFESGSAVIRPEGRALITRLAKVLAKSSRPMKVEGHTDSVPYSRSGYDNWDLGGDRANSMRRVLMAGGVKSSDFLSVAGFADTRLKDPNNPTSLSNRRVSVLLPIPGALSDEVSDVSGPDGDLLPDIDLTAEKPVRDKMSEPPPRNALGLRSSSH